MRFAPFVLLFIAAASVCSQTLNLPPRPAQAPTGSQFVTITSRMSLTERENWIYAQVLSGNIPNFLRTLKPIISSVTINGSPHSCTCFVTPDYLAIGTDADYFLQPVTPILAQRLCRDLGLTLPTRKIVNQIWTNASVKMPPQPIPASAEMTTVPVFADHNTMVRTQRNLFTNTFPLGALVAGDKKDVILSTKIYTNFTGPTKPVVIFGWHYQSGDPIQPLYNGHEETYADYSHGFRLVLNSNIVDGLPNTVSNVLVNPALAALLSDEGPAEGTSTNGVIAIPRYPLSPWSPAILRQPRSQTVPPGTAVTFTSSGVGDPPLGYVWRSNGTNIPSAIGPSLSLSNVQTSAALNYSVVLTNSAGSATSRVAVLRLQTNIYSVVFAEDFESDASSRWTLFWGSSNNVPDYTVDWTFDHTFVPYTFNGSADLVPPAPASENGSSRTLRFTVNNNDTNPVIAGVSAYPVTQLLITNFSVKFQMWINYPGNAAGASSTGSTEHATFGFNHLGSQVNWAAPTGLSSDGIWFAVDGEGGTSGDYRAYVGNPSGPPAELKGVAASGLTESNNAAALYQTLFPATRFETAGSPGKNWVEVELRQTNNVISWRLDGTLIAQRTNSSSFTSGKIMLGFMDTFNSIANPSADAFVLFDNVRIEELTSRPRFLSIARLTNQRTDLVLAGVLAQSYSLDVSSNCVDWSTVAVLHITNAPVLFTDLSATNPPPRFYRARLGTAPL
jgi:hypothetical protein